MKKLALSAILTATALIPTTVSHAAAPDTTNSVIVQDETNDVKYKKRNGYKPQVSKRAVDIEEVFYSYNDNKIVVKIKTTKMTAKTVKAKVAQMRWTIDGVLAEGNDASQFKAIHKSNFKYCQVVTRAGESVEDCKMTRRVDLENNTVIMKIDLNDVAPNAEQVTMNASVTADSRKNNRFVTNFIDKSARVLLER